MYSEERQQINDELRLSSQCNNGISKNKNLLDNTPNQPTRFSTKNWIEINDDTRGMYSTNSQMKYFNAKIKFM